MKIEGLRFRKTDINLQNTDKIRLRLSNRDVAERIRVGDNPEETAIMRMLRQPLDLKISAVENLQNIDIPNMIDVPGMPFRIMLSEVAVGLFNQFVDAGYATTGPCEGKLLTQLKGTPGKALTYLSLFDGRALANALSDQTGKIFRIPTEAELKSAHDLVGDKLSGRNWEWTETPYSKGTSLSYLLRSLDEKFSGRHNPGFRSSKHAIRLVQDK